MHSVAWRFALGAMAAIIVAIIVSHSSLSSSARQSVITPARQQVEASLALLVESYHSEDMAILYEQIVEVERLVSNLQVQLYDAQQGGILAGSLLMIAREYLTDGNWQMFRLDRGAAATPKIIGLMGTELSPGLWLLVGMEIAPVLSLESLMTTYLLNVLIAVVLVCLAAGLILQYFLQLQVAEVVGIADEIVEGNLAQRIPSSLAGSEFDLLINSLNRMIDRIDELVTTTRSVTDSVAHDFRSPLTRLKVKLEQQLDQASSVDELRDSIRSALADLDTLLLSLLGLLEIAHVEGKLQQEQMTKINLQEIVNDLCEFYRPLADENNLRLQLESHPTPLVKGHRELLTHAISNLLDNALKYVPSGGSIHLQVIAEPFEACIIIADDGPGIPPEKREFVKRRFTRLDEARTTPGAGLGLSLVAAVMRQHGGTFSLQDNHPGVKAIVRIPFKPRIKPRFGWRS